MVPTFPWRDGPGTGTPLRPTAPPALRTSRRAKISDVDPRRYVNVPATVLWTAPTAPRDVDRWAVAPEPSPVAWLADLDAASARPGLFGRALTQLECGEPVLVIGDPDRRTPAGGDQGWLKIVAPRQPSALDGQGYPGWVVAAHVGAQVPDRPPLATAAGRPQGVTQAQAFIAVARTHLGLAYLWAGMSHWGLDCSGLVHLSLRRVGVLIPRDAADQYDACEHIRAVDARPGDLLFFAHQGKRPHHVGILTGPASMLHAPESGSVIIEEPLSAQQRSTIVGAGRLPLPARATRRAG
jgi:cell wall-associated NlpC family hydrolase